MNALFFVSSLDSGGVENYLLRFLQHSHKKFNNIYVYCKSGRGGQLESRYLELPNVEVVKQKHGYFDIASFKKLERFFKDKKIGVACDFTGNFSGRTLSAAKKAGVAKRVVFYRSAANAFAASLLKNIYNDWVRYLVSKNATDILSNSKSAFNFFYGKSWQQDKRFNVIYNGMDTSQFTQVKADLREEFGIPNDAFVVGHTGRFNPAKNHETIMQVAAQLLEKHQDIYFILCGNGVQENLSQTQIWKNFEQRILLFENRTDIPQFLNTMDCYFFPSTREGQPNALIEAMLVGLPYVASNIEPIVETVDNAKNLFDPSDIHSFVNAIEYIYTQRKNKTIREQRPEIEAKFDADMQFGNFYSVLASEG